MFIGFLKNLLYRASLHVLSTLSDPVCFAVADTQEKAVGLFKKDAARGIADDVIPTVGDH